MMGIPDIISYKAFGITFTISLEVVKAGIWNENNMKKDKKKLSKMFEAEFFEIVDIHWSMEYKLLITYI